MKVSVLFCGVSDIWQAKVVALGGRLCGFGKIEYLHVGIMVDTTDIGGKQVVYDMTWDGLSQCSFEDYNEPIEAALTIELDGTNKDDLKYIGEIVGRILFAAESDIKLDTTDLLRLCLRRPLQNHTCVSFARFALGLYRNNSVRTAHHLYEELENDGRYYHGI